MKNLIITALTGLSLLACADKNKKKAKPQSTKDKTETKKETKNLFSVKRLSTATCLLKMH